MIQGIHRIHELSPSLTESAMEALRTELIADNEARRVEQVLIEQKEDWRDGSLTAGPQAAEVKKNKQLHPESQASKQLCRFLQDKLVSNPLTHAYAIPKRVHSMMFSKSEAGDGYGWHVDNPFTSSGRRDLSFTIALSDPQTYRGGQLEIQAIQSQASFELQRGEIVIYPSSSLHRVKTVHSGVRHVCIGWIESYVKSAEDRELLFNLNAGAQALLSKHGRSEELDLIFQAYTNTLRRLSD